MNMSNSSVYTNTTSYVNPYTQTGYYGNLYSYYPVNYTTTYPGVNNLGVYNGNQLGNLGYNYLGTSIPTTNLGTTLGTTGVNNIGTINTGLNTTDIGGTGLTTDTNQKMMSTEEYQLYLMQQYQQQLISDPNYSKYCSSYGLGTGVTTSKS